MGVIGYERRGERKRFWAIYIQGDSKKTSFSVLAGYPVKIYKKKLY